MNDAPRRAELDDEPDPRLVWRWVGAALRPWLGWILVAIGGLLMLLGYFGVSREAIPAKQIPYLVSGGIGGMFFAVVGAYFLGTQELRNDSGRLDRLERMVEELHATLLRRADAPDPTVAGSATSAIGMNGNGALAPARKVVTVEGAELFHRSSCSMVEGKDTAELTPATAKKRSLRPCPLCAPVPAAATAN